MTTTAASAPPAPKGPPPEPTGKWTNPDAVMCGDVACGGKTPVCCASSGDADDAICDTHKGCESKDRRYLIACHGAVHCKGKQICQRQIMGQTCVDGIDFAIAGQACTKHAECDKGLCELMGNMDGTPTCDAGVCSC